jgi:ParB family transcriptional regulator, chromosome partitioning protein
LHLIEVGQRLRKLKAAQVIHIRESMAQQGQLQPIIVEPRGDGRYNLLAGNYRKEAAEKLGWDTIRAEVREGLSTDESSFIEIDENLKRNDLTPAERAAHTAQRKEIYERLYPETKKGATGRGRKKIRRIGEASHVRFTKATAAETGQSERTVQRDAKRGEQERIDDIVGTSLDRGDELDALTQLDPAKADQLIDQAVAGEQVSAKAEVAKTKPPRKTKSIPSTMAVDEVPIKTHAPQQDDSIALQQAQADLKLCQAEVERLNERLDPWNQGAGDAALETPMAVIATLDAIFAKAQGESFWGNVSKESVKKLIVNLSAAVASAHTIKCCLNKAKANTATVH